MSNHNIIADFCSNPFMEASSRILEISCLTPMHLVVQRLTKSSGVCWENYKVQYEMLMISRPIKV